MFIGKGKDHPLFNRIEKQCVSCGKAIFVIPARLKTQKTCSMACYTELKKQMSPSLETRKKISERHKKSGFRPPTMKGKNNPCWKGGKPFCLMCGRRTKDYSSKVCKSCSPSYYTKERSPRWKGGVTNKDRLERVRFRRYIQKLVFKRDNYKCQICGQDGDLQVDHIQPWAEYVELRFDMNNCRTLCVKCHYKITFGKPMPPKVRAWGHNFLGGN